MLDIERESVNELYFSWESTDLTLPTHC